MKALVVDSDRIARSVVKRLLSHVNVETVEAENGLVALNVLAQADPDVVVIEVDMPILNGYDCLAAIRQSPLRPDILVICITVTGTPEAVTRMVGVGVADFLLNPINPVKVLPRIKSLLVRVGQWRQRTSTRSIASMLIVDHDPDFIAFAKPLLENGFEILDASSTTRAAVCYRDANRTRFFLLSSSGEIPAGVAERYAGVAKKPFGPQTFMEEFRHVVLREQSPYEKLRDLVREGMRAETLGKQVVRRGAGPVHQSRGRSN